MELHKYKPENVKRKRSAITGFNSHHMLLNIATQTAKARMVRKDATVIRNKVIDSFFSAKSFDAKICD